MAMLLIRRFVLIALLAGVCPLMSWGQTASGEFPATSYKFKVTDDGIYAITFDDLKNAGIDPASLKPNRISIACFPTGMLPQKNSAPRPSSLQEIAIVVQGEEDGKFDRGDRIIFFGQGPDKYTYRASKGIFAYENNLYSDENFYFLIPDGGSDGLRVGKSSLQPGAHNAISQYTDLGYYETDQYNDLKSGRDWFGEQFDVKNEITIRYSMAGIIPDSDIRFVSNLMTQSYETSNFKIFWNGKNILDRDIDTIPQTTYGAKGAYGIDTLTINSSSVSAPSATNQDIRILFTKGGGNRSVGYLNYILFALQRKAALYNDVTQMTIPNQNTDVSDLSIESLTSDALVWDVTNPALAVQLNVSFSGSIAKVALPTTSDRSLVLFKESGITSPKFVGTVTGRNLRSLDTPALLIVAHANFVSQAQRLASYRTSTGIHSTVVTTQEIYDQFSGGRQDITAIRDFVRFLYNNQPGKLKNLLLFGRGSYDYKNRLFNNTNFVPIYESRNSLEPLATYSSDDYYGFLEENEGEWLEEYGKDHTLEIGVGRLPVSTADQATTIVDNLIAYGQSNDLGLWRQQVLFVADDGDYNIHQSQAEDLAEQFENTYKSHQTSKVYLDAYVQQTVSSGQISPEAKAALAQALNRGYKIVNYTGHGSERVWMQERILDQETPAQMRNDAKMPVFLTATCEFGRHDDPLLMSTAEMLLFRKRTGAIALVTTSRPVNTVTNSLLNRAFYNAYFDPLRARPDLGEVFRVTKNKSLSGVANRNFSLLGDPSMTFSPGGAQAVITSVATADGSNIIKALSQVTMMGQIKSNGSLVTDFNGTLDVEVFDQRSANVTLGDESSPFNYKLWDHSIFRGKAKVVNGEFAFEFVVPQGVSSQVANGKVVLYAHDKNLREATGVLFNLKVGGVDPNPATDNSGPAIELFMGDSTFVEGGYANARTFVVAKLSDKNGINISGYDKGTIEATLDGSTTFRLTEFYQAAEDDFTSGWVKFPLSDLKEGQHTIVLRAFDTFGNPGTATLSFLVGENGALVVEDFYGFPNPFSDGSPVTLEFRHNRTGEDLEVQVAIFDTMGKMADFRQFTVSASTYKVPLYEWDGKDLRGTKMTPGVYFVKAVIRSMSDGAKNAKVAKLILTN